MKILKQIVTITIPSALVFGMLGHLVVFYKECSNYVLVFKIALPHEAFVKIVKTKIKVFSETIRPRALILLCIVCFIEY